MPFVTSPWFIYCITEGLYFPSPILFTPLLSSFLASPSLCIYDSVLVLFCIYIPHISELIGHLSFSVWLISLSNIYPVDQGAPAPRPQPGIGLLSTQNLDTGQDVSSRRVSKASLSAPHCSPSLALTPEPSHLLTLLPEPSVTFLPESSPLPHPWKNWLLQNWSLMPKMLGTAALDLSMLSQMARFHF